jgi:hypothetical protein
MTNLDESVTIIINIYVILLNFIGHLTCFSDIHLYHNMYETFKHHFANRKVFYDSEM